MIYDNSTSEEFYQYYEDDPLGFLSNAKIDTEEARDKTLNLMAKCRQILITLDKVEK